MIQQTSLMAYKDFYSILLNARYTAILSVLDGEGLTDMEISRRLGFSDPNTIRPRRNELVKMGFIIANGKRNCSVTGKKCLTWVKV